MKKLYAGLAAAALTATGIACTAGAASATESPWPNEFVASQIVTTTTGTTFALGDYDTGQQEPDGEGGTYDVYSTALVEVVGTTVSTVDLGDGASPKAIAAHGDTVYAVGIDADGAAELWTVTASGDVTTTAAPDDDARTLSVSNDGKRLGIAGGTGADVLAVSGGTATSSLTWAESEGGDAHGAFSPNGETFYVAADNDSLGVDLWSLPTAGGSAGTPLPVAEPVPSDDPDYPETYTSTGPIAVDTDGAIYVATTNGDDSVKVIKSGEVTTSQPINGNINALALSTDGKTLYASKFSDSVEAFAVARLGSYDKEDDYTSYAPTYGAPATADALTVDADGNVVIAESEHDYDDATETSSVSNQTVDVVSAPGAPSNVTASRGDTWAEISFSPATSTGSSAWTSTDPDDYENTPITYTVTLHDTTDASKKDIVDDGNSGSEDVYIGYSDDDQLVSGDAYTVSVTTTNGLFTSTAATYALAAYKEPVTDNTPPAPEPAPEPAPAQVTKIKPATIKASAKKVKLKLPGINVAKAPGKVKVYQGKKLVGKAKIVNGKLVVKFKKHLHHGKHKLKLSYKGSAKVAKFHKKVKLRVK